MKRSIVLLVASVLLAAAPASANFLEVEMGARAMGMGGAFVAVADDVTALHWNPAGLADIDGVQVFGMRTSVYGVDGLSEDAAMAGWGSGCRGLAAGWMRTGATDLYNEDTIVLGYGQRLLLEGLRVGASVKRFSVDAPGYEYYDDPAYAGGGDDAYSGDIGLLYHSGEWTYAATYRNIGEPELQLLDTTEQTDKVTGELRLGASYLFREVMLMTAEWRVPSEVPSYYESDTSLNIGTEIWFYDVFALRAGMNRDRITAGLGIKADYLRLDVALLSERRIGSLYRLSATFAW